MIGSEEDILFCNPAILGDDKNRTLSSVKTLGLSKIGEALMLKADPTEKSKLKPFATFFRKLVQEPSRKKGTGLLYKAAYYKSDHGIFISCGEQACIGAQQLRVLQPSDGSVLYEVTNLQQLGLDIWKEPDSVVSHMHGTVPIVLYEGDPLYIIAATDNHVIGVSPSCFHLHPTDMAHVLPWCRSTRRRRPCRSC
jgi:hypothetical protein